MDSFLRLEDAKLRQLAQDDDSGGNRNARIMFPCQRAGTYRIICTSFNEGATGNFTVQVAEK
jgi:serine protease Do